MTKLVEVAFDRQSKPVDEVVSALEVMLEDAKAGQIVAVAIAAECADGSTLTVGGASRDRVVLLGALERMKHRILMEMDEQDYAR